MAGYEELTPDQLIYIANIMFYIALVFGSSIIVRSFLNYFTARVIHFRIEREIVKNITDDIVLKKSLFSQIRLWWSNRKKKSVDPFDQYVIKPIEEVK